MAKPKSKQTKQHVVFNRRILIFLFASVALLGFSIHFFRSQDKELGFTLLTIALFLSLGVFLTPLFFIFNKENVTVVWLFQNKRKIPWNAVGRIIAFKWGEVHRDLPKYEILYHLNYKGCIVTKQFDIPKTKKTEKLLEAYAKSKIV